MFDAGIEPVYCETMSALLKGHVDMDSGGLIARAAVQALSTEP
jgi:hypothetical protein